MPPTHFVLKRSHQPEQALCGCITASTAEPDEPRTTAADLFNQANRLFELAGVVEKLEEANEAVQAARAKLATLQQAKPLSADELEVVLDAAAEMEDSSEGLMDTLRGAYERVTAPVHASHFYASRFYVNFGEPPTLTIVGRIQAR